MKLETIDFFKGRPCEECHTQTDVKELYVGANVMALCTNCREKLKIELTENMKIKEYQIKSTRTINRNLSKVKNN